VLKSKTVFVVDPGSNTNALSKLLNELEANEIYVFITHGHFDHVIGVDSLLKRKSPVNIYMDPLDRQHLKLNNFYMKVLGHTDKCEDFAFCEFEKFEPTIDASLVFHASPGHSSGSTIIQMENIYFTGDSVLSRSVFAPTVRGSDQQKQIHSVVSILSEAKHTDWILPGHGKPRTLEETLLLNGELKAIVSRVC
jgi:glyoxylase-like metal-dependent hydrolase (beta-lactamase superfamily II)